MVGEFNTIIEAFNCNQFARFYEQKGEDIRLEIALCLDIK